jgi:hypothetical protein
VYQLQLPATSLFGATDNRHGLQSYVKFLSANDMPVIGLVTTMYFDENSETPKLYFKPARPLEDEEIRAVLELAEHEDATKAVTLSVYQADTGDTGGSKPYNPKKDEFTVDDTPEETPAPKAKAAPKAVAVSDDDVEEPTRVSSKSADAKPVVNNLQATLDQWG